MKFNSEKIFSEVIAGRTPVDLVGRPAFFRHLTPQNRGDSAYYYEKIIAQCEGMGISTRDKRLEEVKAAGTWTEQHEGDYLNAQSYLDNLNNTVKTLALPSQVAEMKVQIEQAKEKFREVSSNRAAAIGTTAEQFADKKANEKFIFDNLFADSPCSTHLFSPDEYDELEESDIGKVVTEINVIVAAYSDSYLKKAALSRLVQDLIQISDGDAMRFYGVPAIKLTYYQIELLNYGKWFQSILADPKKKPPAHMMDNPDALIEWSTGQKNAASILNAPGQNVAIVGATPEDLKAIAGDSAVSMDSLIKKSGKQRGANLAKMLGHN